MKLSVVICAYNPKPAIFQQVFDSLKKQTLDKSAWELIIVDNNSNIPIDSWVDLSWHPNAKIVQELTSGLIFSRIKGNETARGKYVVTVDDDTPLQNDYLTGVINFFDQNDTVGIIGGKCKPVYETEIVPEWINLLPSSISGRDFGEEIIVERHDVTTKLDNYPKYSPILMAYRKAVFDDFITQFDSEKNGILGRKGNSLTSGEDNDIILYFYKNGWGTAYCPHLCFSHFIPAYRLTFQYAKKLLFHSNRSWVKVLALHGICPWHKIPRTTIWLRNLKSYIFLKAWVSETNYLKWKGACGTFKGLSEI
ncbi:hypothetical protein BCY91_12230 [Pelobium manganitolerans]|uniref:Glycosyltransferase 2-like domain-containing protein n=1 Tax=Pelobium manganitolerans TaxID=1842495 RepID=A0A419S1Q2_9SPHI|nr:glycosyltransferase [Pelobium manganitolerans]RKD12411.1 hypothetical protein BCY91_12230 [Pelobium manganitolerans]